MDKRNAVNLGLFTFIVIVAITLWLGSNKQSEMTRAITSLTQDDIQSIIIKRADKESIHLKKQHGQWRLTRPYNTATNQFRMDTLLRLVETIPQSSYPLKNLHKYGLEAPKLEVIFNKDSATETAIKFGNSDPIKLRRYIAIADKLYLTNDTYFYALNSVATDYIDLKLLPKDFQISQLHLPQLKLAVKDNKWTVSPQPENFSMDSVNELISDWQTIQAIDIKPFKSKAAFNSKQTIKIVGTDASTYTFNIMKKKDELILIDRLKGLQYHFPIDKTETLLSLPVPAQSEQSISEN